jgi:predicted nucleotidyltransferase
MKVSEINNELEDYRLHALYMIKENSKWIKKVAEDVLQVKVTAIKPIGSVTNPGKFHEESDIDVGIYVGDGKEMSEELSETLQTEMINHPLNDIGVVNTLVFK